MTLFRRLHLYVWSLVEKPLDAFTISLLNKMCLGYIEGISVCDASFASIGSKENFLKRTQEAMELIRENDLRRYRRICQQFKFIVNQELAEGGNYQQRLKVCNVDYSRYLASDNLQWRLRAYACLLIHEATHGLLLKKGIPYNEGNRERIERLCHLEEYRFALHFEAGYADRNPGPFNPQAYEPYWERSGRSRKLAYRKRLREVFRAFMSSDR